MAIGTSPDCEDGTTVDLKSADAIQLAGLGHTEELGRLHRLNPFAVTALN